MSPGAAAVGSRVRHDEAAHRRDANRAVAVSAAGLAATGLAELALALVTGSVALLGDAIHVRRVHLSRCLRRLPGVETAADTVTPVRL